MTASPTLSLLTFVLEHHHCALLDDWFGFFDQPLTELVVHVGEDPRIEDTLARMCRALGIRFTCLGQTTALETTERELALLSRQFDAVRDGFGCVVRLDCLPFKAYGVTWQDAAFEAMRETSARFITGTTRPFRADQPLALPGLMRTQRVSNCFLIITPGDWHTVQAGVPDSGERHGRFITEGAAEDFLASHDLWGLRLLNRQELRIFHLQEWSPRIFEVRKAFRAGKHIGRFLEGYEDDFMGPRAMPYMQPKRPIAKRVRIVLGAWRREIVTRLYGR